MRSLKKILSLLLLVMVPMMFTGCWNYREINQMAIVTAFAIDKDPINNKYNIAVEVIHSTHTATGGQIKTEIYKSKGDTIFEAVRELIPVVGRKTFWSHNKVIIICKSIAESDIGPVLDWVFRDQEPRRDIDVFISKGFTAEQIIYAAPELESTFGFNLKSTINNQKNTNRFPKAELGDIANCFSKDEKGILAPLIENKADQLDKVVIFGSAILKRGKAVGYLSGEDTFNALWIQGKVKTGTFPIKDFIHPKTNVTIEIFDSSLKTRVINQGGKVEIVVNISADVGLAEISKELPFTKNDEQEKIKEEIEKNIIKRITNTIKKVQNEDKTDVFNFYNNVRIQQPKYYKKVSANWGEEFSNLSVVVKADVHLRGSAVKSKQIEGSD